jgi:hypothetical protein
MVRNIRWFFTSCIFFFYRLAGGLVLHKLLLSPPNNIFHKESEKDYIFKGLRELVVLNNLKYFKSLKQFLIAFFFIALEFKL